MSLSSTLASAGEQPLYGHATPTLGGGGNEQAPFEYVTLTGNVIRSVVPPGKGTNINYKVNQGYARPYGASAAQPPAAAPKSPVSYPPQTQQWGAPQQPQQQQWGGPQAKPAAANPYATLPRSNVGQQGYYY